MDDWDPKSLALDVEEVDFSFGLAIMRTPINIPVLSSWSLSHMLGRSTSSPKIIYKQSKNHSTKTFGASHSYCVMFIAALPLVSFVQLSISASKYRTVVILRALQAQTPISIISCAAYSNICTSMMLSTLLFVGLAIAAPAPTIGSTLQCPSSGSAMCLFVPLAMLTVLPFLKVWTTHLKNTIPRLSCFLLRGK